MRGEQVYVVRILHESMDYLRQLSGK